MAMELFEVQNRAERSEEERRKTAEEIGQAISNSLSRLLYRDGLSEDHSNVVELRQQYDINVRAMRELDTEDSLARVA